MIDAQRIIQTVFERYGIVLSADDPIVLSSMTQEAILEQILEQIDTAIQGVIAQLEMLGAGYSEQNRTALTQATQQVTEQLKATLEQTMRHETAQAVSQIRQAQTHVVEAMERRAAELHGLRDWSLCSAGLSVFCALAMTFLIWWQA